MIGIECTELCIQGLIQAPAADLRPTEEGSVHHRDQVNILQSDGELILLLICYCHFKVDSVHNSSVFAVSICFCCSVLLTAMETLQGTTESPSATLLSLLMSLKPCIKENMNHLFYH